MAASESESEMPPEVKKLARLVTALANGQLSPQQFQEAVHDLADEASAERLGQMAGLLVHMIADANNLMLPLLTHVGFMFGNALMEKHFDSKLLTKEFAGSAVPLFEACQNACIALGNEEGVVRMRIQRALALQKAGKLVEVLDEYDQLEQLLIRFSMRAELAGLKLCRANALEALGRMDEANAAGKAAQEAFHELGIELPSPTEALGQNKRASNLEDPTVRLLQACTQFSLGQLASEQLLQVVLEVAAHVTHDSVLSFRRWLVGMIKSPDTLALAAAGAAMPLADLLSQRGLHEDAVLLYDVCEAVISAPALAQDEITVVVLAQIRFRRAIALQESERYSEALDEYDRAEVGLKQSANEADLAGLYMNRGNLLRHLGRLKEAKDEFGKAEEIFRRLGMAAELAKRQMNRANLDMSLGNEGPIEVLELGVYGETEKVLRSQGKPLDLAVSQLNHGLAREKLADMLSAGGMDGSSFYQQALDAIDAAEKTLTQNGVRDKLAQCQVARAGALSKMGRLPEAVAAYKAVNLQALSEDSLHLFHSQFAVTLLKLRRISEALDQFTLGRVALRHAREVAGIDENSLEFVAHRNSLIHNAVFCYLHAGKNLLAFQAVQDGKAGVLADFKPTSVGVPPRDTQDVESARRSLCESLKQAPADDIDPGTLEQGRQYLKLRRLSQTGSTQAANRTAKRRWAPSASGEVISGETIQAVLPEGWALLDFWVLNDSEVKVFVLTRKEGLRVESLPVSQLKPEFRHSLGVLECLARSSLGAFQPEIETDQLAALRTFYNLLFEPLTERIGGLDGLYLVPHDFLNTVPLHACVNEDGRYLCDEFEIAYLPSAAMLPQLPTLRLNRSMLTVGNPEQGTERSLPFAEWEVQELKRRLDKFEQKCLTGSAATVSAISNWETASIVLLGCHGGGVPQFAPLSHLCLHDDLLLAHELLYRMPQLFQGTLAILNGCQTGVRDYRAIDEAFGLMSAFLLKGASLVLATQWKISDFCAAEMVTTFLTQLVNEDNSPPQALQTAIKRVRAVTAEEVLARCRGLVTEARATGDRHGLKRLADIAEHACRSKSDRIGESRALGNPGKLLTKPCEVPTVNESIKRLERLKPVEPEARVYDHPKWWASFYLVGRIA